MDSSLIEKSAINYLIDELIVTKKLSPYISENDKEPSWDGNIYIYRETNFSKENLLGRVPVQVKGKQEKSKNLKKEKISYPVETVDLKNYLNDGGVIFFVILIDEENLKKRKIYYTDLPPVRLKIELEKSKNQITKSIKFKEFSSDNQRKVSILLNCLQNFKKQASFLDIPLLTIDELNKNNIERIEIPFVSTKEETPQEALLNSDIYLYARLKNSPIFQPVKVLIDELETHEKQKIDISIDNKKYYSSIQVIRKKNSTKFILGESFSLIIKEDKKIAQLNYKNSDKIKILANDLEFMIHQIEKGYFLFNGKKIEIDYKNTDFSNFNLKKQKEDLKKIKEIVQLLNILNCQEDLKLSEITKEGWRQLNYLIRAFVYDELVEGLVEPSFSVRVFNIGQLKFLICVKKEEDGKYKLSDFFKEEFSVKIELQGGKKFPISQYIILKKEDFYLANNIKYNILLPSFKKIKRYSETIESINQFLLKLILAYDESQKKEILLIAKDFSEWICSEFSEEELIYSIKELNKLQIIKRLRKLNNEEKEKIYEILENKDINDEIRFGSYVLLEQKVAAKRYFEKLNEKSKKEFINYPIYNLWKKMEEINNGEIKNADSK